MARRRSSRRPAPAVAFHLLHARCGSRIRQQHVCPTCHEVVVRAGLVRGYEFAKGQYVRVTNDELKALKDYRQQVRRLVDEKIAAKEITVAPVERRQVIDLMGALRRKIESRRGSA